VQRRRQNRFDGWCRPSVNFLSLSFSRTRESATQRGLGRQTQLCELRRGRRRQHEKQIQKTKSFCFILSPTKFFVVPSEGSGIKKAWPRLSASSNIVNLGIFLFHAGGDEAFRSLPSILFIVPDKRPCTCMPSCPKPGLWSLLRQSWLANRKHAPT
jgi:hypothetical protein